MRLEQGQQIVFGPFRLDLSTHQLWHREQTVALQPKPLAVLRYLAERPGQVVAKQELLKAVWAGVHVTKAVVKGCIRAIREALEEDATAPRYLETVGREGYRFIEQEQGAMFPVQGSTSALAPRLQSPVPIIVGREQELGQLEHYFEGVLHGERQLVFVTGEPGIGKTALVDLLQERLRKQGQVWVGRGQCVEQYGEGEAYLPILDALADLARGPRSKRLTESLRRYAPTWLVQMPALASEAERQALQATVHGATHERRLREIIEALEAVSDAHPLVFVLEDLHWSDPSTVEWLSVLVQRRTPTRLFVIGTYRPTELVLGKHPLKGMKQELHAKGHCQEMRVELLPEHKVGEYLARRFPRNTFPPELGMLIHRRTEGNALFMVNVVEELVSQGIVGQDSGNWRLNANLAVLSIPNAVRQLIERQIERLSEEEQRVLEVASAAGTEFPVAVVAAALKQEIDTIEDACESIAWQGHFLEECGITEWPDGTVSGQYSFRHALYQNVLYERMAEARRVRLHRRIGERAEAGYRKQAKEIAVELAVHFERGRDYQRAVQYLRHAGENAAQRSAHAEAIRHLTKGLELLKTLPDTSERTQQEITLQIALGGSLMATKGYAAQEAEYAYARARELCQRVGDTPQLFRVLYGLCAFFIVRAEYQTARELGEQLLGLAQRIQPPAPLVEAHSALGQLLFFLGEFTPAGEHFEQGLAFYAPRERNPHVSGFAQDCGIVCLSLMTWFLWLRGNPDQALQKNYEALSLTQELSHPFSLAYTLVTAARHHLLRREVRVVRERAEALIALCAEQGFALRMAQGTIFRGWALAMQGQGEEGIAQLREGMTACRATGTQQFWPSYLAMLAEAYGTGKQPEEGLPLLTEALSVVDKTGEHWYEAELYRLKGELTLQQCKVQGSKFHVQTSPKLKAQSQRSKKTNPQSLISNPQAEAEVCFHKAIEIARQQQAKSWELRAVTSLARLWQQQGRKDEARQMLAEIHNWFTEGFDTKDLQEAKALLADLK